MVKNVGILLQSKKIGWDIEIIRIETGNGPSCSGSLQLFKGKGIVKNSSRGPVGHNT